MNYTFPIIATSRDGDSKILYTVEDVRKFAFNKKNGGVGRYWEETNFNWFHHDYRFRPGSLYSRDRCGYSNYWILRDDRGRVVNPCDFVLPVKNWKDRKGNFEYRNGPVPDLYHHRAGGGMNHTAKKNSGSGHRNRNRAKAIYDAKEYGVRNNVDYLALPWEIDAFRREKMLAAKIMAML